MSRIGKKPVSVLDTVTLEVKGNAVSAKGPKGELLREFPPCVTFEVAGKEVIVGRNKETKFARSMHGTARSLVANMIEGVGNGFTKILEIQGVGFKAQMKGRNIVLALGFSHEINYEPPEGVEIVVNNNTEVVITGADNQKVGQAAAQIRSYYKAEPYKGKGVRYKGEVIRRKVGKAVS
ncbi:MAG: large subunit ribosomal protein L6 [Verrucomicrobiales bacterium]|jgi:large subunit ribosomal protein L6